MPYDRYHKDHQAENWWATVSGAGTASGTIDSWADDYTRHRTSMSPTYTSVDDLIGRQDGHTGRELDAPKL